MNDVMQATVEIRAALKLLGNVTVAENTSDDMECAELALWRALGCLATRPNAGASPVGSLAAYYRHMLLELLAVIHRDGGHRMDEVGLETSYNEALQYSAERAQAEPSDVAELVGAIKDIATQKLASEMDYHTLTGADWQGGYETLVINARAAIMLIAKHGGAVG